MGRRQDVEEERARLQEYRIREIPGEPEHTVGRGPWVGYLAFGEQGCSVVGISTHAGLSVGAHALS